MKDIAIVGNSYILKQQNAGKLIDAHEYIYRVQPMFYSEDITGIRTDCYCCEPETYQRYTNLGLKCRLWMMTGEYLNEESKLVFQKKYGFSYDYIDFPGELEREMRIFANSRPTDNVAPTTGGKVIYTVNKMYPSARITIYGFDWYEQSPNNYWMGAEKVGAPDKTDRRFTIERNFFRNVFTKKYPNITFNTRVIEKPVKQEVKKQEVKEEVKEEVSVLPKEKILKRKISFAEVKNEKNVQDNS